MREFANVQTTCFEKRFIARKNRDKIDELKQILHRLHCDYIKILSVDSIPIPDVEETGLTVSEKAKSKAESAKHFVENKKVVLADDSGLCRATLEGAPGRNSARYAKGRDLNAAMDKIIVNLSNQKIESRHAYFACVLHLIVPNGESYTFEGQLNGRITRTKLGQ
jgi:non-canonical purine NTP pyrophosphatase (RdgB/HAM1 family)